MNKTDRRPTAFVHDSSHAKSLNALGIASAHFEKEIAVWRDPSTPPQTRTDCCETSEIDSTGVIVCTRYCTDCQWMYVHAWLVVDINPSADVEAAINHCHDQAAAAGLVGGIITAALGGGGAALKAAIDSYVGYFTACFTSSITQQVLGVRVDTRPGWGNWEGC